MRKNIIDFIGIGAQKSGTSWLDERLRELPDFSLTPIKELHYFDRSPIYPSPNMLAKSSLKSRLTGYNWAKKAIKFGTLLLKRDFTTIKWFINWSFSNIDDKWYLSLFDSMKGLTGEITPCYGILIEKDIAKMYKLVPDAKIILLLRNPVDRAWSHYRFAKADVADFNIQSEKTADIIQFMNSDNQTLRSDYFTIINNFTKYYPKQQLLIGFFDAIKDNPEQLLSDIVDFIGGDVSNIPKSSNLLEKNHVSKKIDIPAEIDSFLKEKYRLPIKKLAEIYGGYCQKWYADYYEKKDLIQKEVLLPTIRHNEIIN